MLLNKYCSVVVLVVSVCSALPQYALQPQTTENLLILTLNIANYNDHGNWTDRLHLMAQEIHKTQPDVIALQEVRFDPDEPSSKLLYQNMGEEILFTLQSVFQSFSGANLLSVPAMFYSPQNDSEHYPVPASLSPFKSHAMWEGLSIISKYPIKETGTVFLTKSTSCSDGNLRATHFASFNTSSGKSFNLFNTHFGLDGPCLVDNVQETVEYIEQHPADYVFLVGDFNSDPTNPALNPLSSAGFLDLWVKTHSSSEPGFTFASDNPVERIDYGWANAALASHVVEVDLFGTTPTDSGIYMSDHFGVTFSFAL